MTKKLLIILITTFVLITGSFFIFRKKTPQKNVVVFWTLQMSDFAPYITSVIKEFELKNPNIKIKWVDVPFSEGEKRTLASVLSDNPPDLVNLNPDFSATLAQKGALFEIPKNKTTQFNKSIMESLNYKGKFYSIPWYATSAITIYNKDLLKKGNITLPETYNQIALAAPTVKAKTGVFIMLPNITENDTFLKILNKYGCADRNTINSKKSEQVFGLFKTLYDKNLIPKETITTTLQEALEKYMSENIVLIGAGANFLNMIKENAPETYAKTDVAPQITGELGQYDFSLMNFVIPLRSRHQKEALDFALFLTNDKNQYELAKLTNVLVVNEKTLKSDFYTKYNPKDLSAKARVISASQINKIEPAYKTKRNQKEINNIINAAIQEILLGKTNIKQSLDKVVKNWNNIEE